MESQGVGSLCLSPCPLSLTGAFSSGLQCSYGDQLWARRLQLSNPPSLRKMRSVLRSMGCLFWGCLSRHWLVSLSFSLWKNSRAQPHCWPLAEFHGGPRPSSLASHSALSPRCRSYLTLRRDCLGLVLGRHCGRINLQNGLKDDQHRHTVDARRENWAQK